jgi:hypothetical protein
MSSLREALDLLISEPDIIRHSPFARPIDGAKECAPLVKVRDDLRAQIGSVKNSAPPLDPKRVWQRFEASGGDLNKLNGLEIRALCTADEFAMKPSFVEALESQPEYLKNGRCLYALVNSYFVRWREMDEPERLEALLTNAINRYPRKSPVIERWRSAHSLFSARAADALADFVVSRKSNLDTVLKLQYVGAATRLAVFTRAKAAELAADRFKKTESSSDEATNLAYLQWMLSELLTDSLLAGALHYATSALILSKTAEKSDAFQKTLRNYVQSHPGLGDPRLRQCKPNWRDMHPDAQQRFLSWIAKENILFFFNTILPRNDENRRRAEFWLRYHNKITDFQVAISEQDAWKLKANKSHGTAPLHSRVTQGSTSAFLMQFMGYRTDHIIVEFSETGNAAYIYDRATFESTNVNLRTPQFQLGRHLKHERWPHRILHLGGWEFSARQKLADLGIFS